jgi:hypothetical protein
MHFLRRRLWLNFLLFSLDSYGLLLIILRLSMVESSWLLLFNLFLYLFLLIEFFEIFCKLYQAIRKLHLMSFILLFYFFLVFYYRIMLRFLLVLLVLRSNDFEELMPMPKLRCLFGNFLILPDSGRRLWLRRLLFFNIPFYAITSPEIVFYSWYNFFDHFFISYIFGACLFLRILFIARPGLIQCI